MNNTKWNEIYRAFYYGNELKSGSPVIKWRTKDIDSGYLSNWEGTWTHFRADPKDWDKIDQLQIRLTPENREYVLQRLKQIHVPGIVENDIVTIFGYRTDVDYI